MPAPSKPGVNWSRVRSLYESGSSPPAIARVLGAEGVNISRQAIAKRARREGWGAQELPAPLSGSAADGVAPPEIALVFGLRDITSFFRLTGVYFLCYEGRVIYVGRSTNAGERISGHARTLGAKFDQVCFLPCSAWRLGSVERAFINVLRPPLNTRISAPEAGDYEIVASLSHSGQFGDFTFGEAAE